MYAYVTLSEMLAAHEQGYDYPCDADSQVCYLDNM